MKNEKNHETVKMKENDITKYKLGTIGNFMLLIFLIIVTGTGALTYYLIHTEKQNYDEQYKQLVSNIPENKMSEQEGEPATIANQIDMALSNVIASQTTNNENSSNDINKKVMNEELVVLYNGMILNTNKMDEVTLQYIDSNSADKDKYIITYYSYENYSFKESKLGTLSSQIYDGLVKIDNVGKIALSEDYDAIPREVKVINTIPSIVTENNMHLVDYDMIKTLVVDLDGNQEQEYILILADKKTGISKIILVDANGKKVADLVSIEKSKWDVATNVEYYLSISNVEVIDIDNDGIMEIVLEIPHATGNPTVSLLKYNNGELAGKTGIECSLINE